MVATTSLSFPALHIRQEKGESAMSNVFKRTVLFFLAFLCITGLAFTISIIRPGLTTSARAATPFSTGTHLYFASNDGYVYSLNATTGALNWRHQIGVSVAWPLAVNNGVVYVPANTSIDALNANNGSLLWSYPTGGMVFAPATNGGVTYFNSNDGNLYAVNATTGALLWTAAASSSSSYSNSFKPTIVNGVVYDAADGDLFTFNASNGTLIWHDSGSAFFGPYTTAPIISNNVLYIGGFEGDGCVSAFNTSDGSDLWTSCSGYGVQSRPTVANGLVYYCPIGSAGTSGSVYALSVTTHQVVWSYRTTQGPSESQVAVTNGIVYAGAGKSVYALNATTGAKVWARFLGTSIGTAGTTTANGLVYVGGSNGNVYAIKQNSSTGTIAWTYTTGGAINTIPVVG